MKPAPRKIVVAGTNSNGQPDFYFVIVLASDDDVVHGRHYEAAQMAAVNNDYEEPFVCFDEQDSTYFPWLHAHFAWESASVVPVDDDNIWRSV